MADSTMTAADKAANADNTDAADATKRADKRQQAHVDKLLRAPRPSAAVP